MDYILADERVVPLDNVDCFMEKVAYHPKSCYIGSHAAMYPFLRHNKRLRHKVCITYNKNYILLVNVNHGSIYRAVLLPWRWIIQYQVY